MASRASVSKDPAGLFKTSYESTGLLSVMGKGRKESRTTYMFLNWAYEWTVMLNSFRHVEPEGPLGHPGEV